MVNEPARAPWDWTRAELESQIGQFESLRLDFKESRIFDNPNDLAQKLTKEVSAFANTEGGTIVIGMVERREGKLRVADHLDDGIELSKWPPQRLQQLIESNISPPLSGLRVRPVPLNEAKTHYAFVIAVPQGSTAHQASDLYYYGRSEYESKALRDHEIRLRMFRGKAANAQVVVRNLRHSRINLQMVSARKQVGSYAELFAAELARLTGDDVVPVDRWDFDVAVQNVGEVNINSFRIKLKLVDQKLDEPIEKTWSFRDGLPDPRGSYGRDAPRFHLDIYPQDEIGIWTPFAICRPDKGLQASGIILTWTLYLRDSIPLRGSIPIVEPGA